MINIINQTLINTVGMVKFSLQTNDTISSFKLNLHLIPRILDYYNNKDANDHMHAKSIRVMCIHGIFMLTCVHMYGRT